MYTPRYLAKFEKHTKYKLWVYHSLPVPLDTFIILVCIYMYTYCIHVCTHTHERCVHIRCTGMINRIQVPVPVVHLHRYLYYLYRTHTFIVRRFFRDPSDLKTFVTLPPSQPYRSPSIVGFPHLHLFNSITFVGTL
jgi:hypothetical protein